MLSKEKLQEIKDSIPYEVSAIYYLFITIFMIVLFSGVLTILLPFIGAGAELLISMIIFMLWQPIFIVPIILTAIALKYNWHPVILKIVGFLLIILGLAALPTAFTTTFFFFQGIDYGVLATIFSCLIWGVITFYFGKLINAIGKQNRIKIGKCITFLVQTGNKAFTKIFFLIVKLVEMLLTKKEDREFVRQKMASGQLTATHFSVITEKSISVHSKKK